LPDAENIVKKNKLFIKFNRLAHTLNVNNNNSRNIGTTFYKKRFTQTYQNSPTRLDKTYIFSHSPLLNKAELIQKFHPAKIKYTLLGDRKIQAFILTDELRCFIEKMSQAILLLENGYKIRIRDFIKLISEKSLHEICKKIEIVYKTIQVVIYEISNRIFLIINFIL